MADYVYDVPLSCSIMLVLLSLYVLLSIHRAYFRVGLCIRKFVLCLFGECSCLTMAYGTVLGNRNVAYGSKVVLKIILNRLKHQAESSIAEE